MGVGGGKSVPETPSLSSAPVAPTIPEPAAVDTTSSNVQAAADAEAERKRAAMASGSAANNVTGGSLIDSTATTDKKTLLGG